jgi:RecA-family ATPase
LVLLDGDPSLGKSTVTLDWAARLSTGTLWPDGEAAPFCNTVILSAEDAIGDTIRPRLEAAGADLERVHVVEGVKDDRLRAPSFPADVDALETLVKEKAAAFVVIDVLAAYLHRSVDSYRDQDVRGALMPLAEMAARTGATVLALRHLSKSGGTNAVYRGGGSIGIIGAARAAMLVGADPDDEARRILAMTKSNLAAMAPALAYRLVPTEHRVARVSWEGATEHKAADLLEPTGTESRTARSDAEAFLDDLLADGPVSARDVKRFAREAGIKARTLDRARQSIGAVSKRSGFGAGAEYHWELVGSSSPPCSPCSPPSEPGVYGAHEASMADLGAWTSDV